MLEFKRVFLKNFMSVGNQGLTIELNRSPSTLVGGRNGAGKSTLLEAITYCLFGKPLKKINLGGMVNSINKKGLEVTIWFSKNGKEYRITRCQKPNKLEFYINDELQDQTATAKDYQTKIEYVLGMDYKLFTQVTILNKERYVPFMEMGSAERRKVVEDILDISVFSTMSDLVKGEIKTIESAISDLDYERGRIQQKITSQQRLIDEAQSNVDERRAEVQDQIKELEVKLDSVIKKIVDVDNEIGNFDNVEEDLKKSNTRKSEFEKIGTTFQLKLKGLSDKVKFLTDNDHCPTCKQGIDESFRQQVTDESNQETDKIKTNAMLLATELQKVLTSNKELSNKLQELQKLNNDLRVYRSERKNIESSIASQEALLGTLVANPKLEQFKTEKLDLQSSLVVLEANMTLKMSEEQLLKLARDYLKDDGIKSSIVKDYIGFINIRLNEYLNAMNFFLNITLNENFEEKINSINRESFTIDNLSTGQKCRVNLAVWMALLEVSSLKNSAVTNLICLDEVLENLDANGVEDFMKLAKDKLSHKNLFVITQRFDEFKDHFRSNIEFKLNDGFTEIVR